MTLTPIDMTKIIPLVTGGGSGIGRGLVLEFLKRGSPKVLITGRREAVLQEAAAKFPGRIFYLVSDASSSSDREALLQWVKSTHPDCNAFVNNAGIQRRIAPAVDTADWGERAPEIEINFAAVVHLCSIFIPWLLSKSHQKCFVANVSSGFAYVPWVQGPVYSATKAAVHNYTVAMRFSLEGTNVRMIEIVPPSVKSNLGGSHDFGEECDVFCAAAVDGLQAGETEVCFGFSETMRSADHAGIREIMETTANHWETPRFATHANKNGGSGST